MIIDDKSFLFFCHFLKKHSGYNLLPEKKYLLETRIDDVLKQNNLDRVEKVVNAIHADPTSKIAIDMMEAMTVNETLFFRDQSPFDLFEKTILPELSTMKFQGPVRIWSAACSTGQEPFSIAMVLEEYNRHNPRIDYEIIASDINRKVLHKAEQGIFSDMEINRGLPENYKARYFTKEGNQWVIDRTIRDAVKFQYLNLQENFILPGSFHFILLRNVLIYFDAATKHNVLNKVMNKINPKGYLLLGSAESIYDSQIPISACQNTRGLYRV